MVSQQTVDSMEAMRVAAYQAGFNDAQLKRSLFCNMPHAYNATPAEIGAYREGYEHGQKPNGDKNEQKTTA